eukprot:UN31340
MLATLPPTTPIHEKKRISLNDGRIDSGLDDDDYTPMKINIQLPSYMPNDLDADGDQCVIDPLCTLQRVRALLARQLLTTPTNIKLLLNGEDLGEDNDDMTLTELKFQDFDTLTVLVENGGAPAFDFPIVDVADGITKELGISFFRRAKSASAVIKNATATPHSNDRPSHR